MAQDLENAVDKIIALLSGEFNTYNAEGKNLNKETAQFWKRLSKRLPDGLGAQFEKAPEANSDKLKGQMLEMGSVSRVQMNFVMYLYNMGTPIE